MEPKQFKRFKQLLEQVRGKDFKPPHGLFAIDPGETTGWAYFQDGELVAKGELITGDPGSIKHLHAVMQRYEITIVVVEDYRVYAHKAKVHSWNPLHTPKLIGGIQFLCEHMSIPVHMQGASTKQFCTNKKLKQWGYYTTGSDHTNDAVRHGCYYLLFNKEVAKNES